MWEIALVRSRVFCLAISLRLQPVTVALPRPIEIGKAISTWLLRILPFQTKIAWRKAMLLTLWSVGTWCIQYALVTGLYYTIGIRFRKCIHDLSFVWNEIKNTGTGVGRGLYSHFHLISTRLALFTATQIKPRDVNGTLSQQSHSEEKSVGGREENLNSESFDKK